MRTALSCYSGLLVGTMGVLYWVMFGTLHHNAAQRTAKVTQINAWQEIWLLHPDMHVYAYRCGCAHMQTDIHLPSSKHLIWVIAISGKNTASGQTLPPALPSAYAPSAFPAHPLASSLLLCFSLFLTYTFHPLKLLFWLIFWLFSHPSIFSLSLFILAPAVMSPRRLAQQTSLQLVKTGWWAAHSCRTLNRFRECVLRWIALITERVREKGGQGGVSGNGWRQGSRDEWKGLTNKWRVWGKKP